MPDESSEVPPSNEGGTEFARLAERPGAARDKLRDAQEDHQVASERVKEAKDTITDIEAGARIGMANA